MNIIIPNWHPIFVHFTVALVITSALIHVVHLMIDGDKESLKIQTATVANWNLWIGAILTVFTIVAGWFAYNSVAHDAPSHAAMTLHKNWALGTAGYIFAIAIWSYRYSIWAIKLSRAIVFSTVLAAGLVGITAWLGGEVVYRYGLGVMSLPKADSHAHVAGSADHSHGEESDMQPHSNEDNHHPQHDSLDAVAPVEKNGDSTTQPMPPGSVGGSGHDSLDSGDAASMDNGQDKAMSGMKEQKPHLEDDHSHIKESKPESDSSTRFQ